MLQLKQQPAPVVLLELEQLASTNVIAETARQPLNITNEINVIAKKTTPTPVPEINTPNCQILPTQPHMFY